MRNIETIHHAESPDKGTDWQVVAGPERSSVKPERGRDTTGLNFADGGGGPNRSAEKQIVAGLSESLLYS